MALAISELLLGCGVLYWCFAFAARDDSSMGAVLFTWGTITALFALVIPGLLLFVPRPIRWLLQPLPACLALVVAGMGIIGLLNR